MKTRQVLFVAKLALSVGLVWYVASKFQLQQALAQLRHLTFAWMMAIVCLYYVQLTIAAFRFREFLGVFGVQFDLRRSLEATWIGYFFSQTFISFLGGDAMRVMRASQSGISLQVATKAVVLDRASGFASQVVLILLVLPFALSRITDPAMRFSLLLLVGSAVAGAIGVFVAARLPGTFRKLKVFDAVADVAGRVLRRITTPRGFVAFFGYSLAINACNILLFYFIGAAMHIELRFVDCLVLLPPVFFISMLPISVSGWGVREGAAIVALGVAGVPSAETLAVSVTYGIGLVLISLPGGLLWLFGRKKSPTTQVPSDAQDKVQRADSQP
jgi:uncharacterized membrane protein YbhN (UPF0104 family)